MKPIYEYLGALAVLAIIAAIVGLVEWYVWPHRPSLFGLQSAHLHVDDDLSPHLAT